MPVCDAYDAMTSKRAYRDSCPPEQALEEVDRETGKQFGPEAAKAFLKVPETIFRNISRPSDPSRWATYPRGYRRCETSTRASSGPSQ
jgi:HD-GYP domain-containing protein (c-di-GMP phosphodiesterase class II)